MRKLITILLINLYVFNSSAQLRESKNGHLIPVQGVTRVLVVYAEVDFSGGNCAGGVTTDIFEDSYGNNWDHNNDGNSQIPQNPGDLFETDLSFGTNPTALVTRKYYEASHGQYIVLGDYYPEVVKVPCNVFNNIFNGPEDHIKFVIDELNNKLGSTLTTANGYTLADFDLYDWDIENDEGLVKILKPTPGGGANKAIDVMMVI